MSLQLSFFLECASVFYLSVNLWNKNYPFVKQVLCVGPLLSLDCAWIMFQLPASQIDKEFVKLLVNTAQPGMSSSHHWHITLQPTVHGLHLWCNQSYVLEVSPSLIFLLPPTLHPVLSLLPVFTSGQQASAAQTFRPVDPVLQAGPECQRVLGVEEKGVKLLQSLITPQKLLERLAYLAGSLKELILLSPFLNCKCF